MRNNSQAQKRDADNEVSGFPHVWYGYPGIYFRSIRNER